MTTTTPSTRTAARGPAWLHELATTRTWYEKNSAGRSNRCQVTLPDACGRAGSDAVTLPEPLAVRAQAKLRAAAATRRLQNSSPFAAPTLGAQYRKERRSWPGRSCRKHLPRPRWEGTR
jgi:hypothetical protein